MESPLSSCGAVQSKFRAASVALVAAADCNSVSVGLDAGHYEGPLRIRLPVKLSPGASAEGAWSFEVPLPRPCQPEAPQQVGLSKSLPMRAAALSCGVFPYEGPKHAEYRATRNMTLSIWY